MARCLAFSSFMVLAWGSNGFGQLGKPSVRNAIVLTPSGSDTPDLARALLNCGGDQKVFDGSCGAAPQSFFLSSKHEVCQVLAGGSASGYVTAEGVIKVWGSNEYGSLCPNRSVDVIEPAATVNAEVAAAEVAEIESCQPIRPAQKLRTSEFSTCVLAKGSPTIFLLETNGAVFTQGISQFGHAGIQFAKGWPLPRLWEFSSSKNWIALNASIYAEGKRSAVMRHVRVPKAVSLVGVGLFHSVLVSNEDPPVSCDDPAAISPPCEPKVAPVDDQELLRLIAQGPNCLSLEVDDLWPNLIESSHSQMIKLEPTENRPPISPRPERSASPAEPTANAESQTHAHTHTPIATTSEFQADNTFLKLVSESGLSGLTKISEIFVKKFVNKGLDEMDNWMSGANDRCLENQQTFRGRDAKTNSRRTLNSPLGTSSDIGLKERVGRRRKTLRKTSLPIFQLRQNSVRTPSSRDEPAASSSRGRVTRSQTFTTSPWPSNESSKLGTEGSPSSRLTPGSPASVRNQPRKILTSHSLSKALLSPSTWRPHVGGQSPLSTTHVRLPVPRFGGYDGRDQDKGVAATQGASFPPPGRFPLRPMLYRPPGVSSESMFVTPQTSTATSPRVQEPNLVVLRRPQLLSQRPPPVELRRDDHPLVSAALRPRTVIRPATGPRWR